MSAPLEWQIFLNPEEDDAGCTGTFDVAHRYAEELVAGGAPWQTYPGVAAHLRACEACEEDLNGLVAAIRLL